MGHDLFTRPAGELFDITPADDTALPQSCRGIYVGASGDLAIVDQKGNSITLVGLAAGVFHPVAPWSVDSTGTTATSIVGVALK